jgi:hypothetical protein
MQLKSYFKNARNTFIQSIRYYLPSLVRIEQGGSEIFASGQFSGHGRLSGQAQYSRFASMRGTQPWAVRSSELRSLFLYMPRSSKDQLPTVLHSPTGLLPQSRSSMKNRHHNRYAACRSICRSPKPSKSTTRSRSCNSATLIFGEMRLISNLEAIHDARGCTSVARKAQDD